MNGIFFLLALCYVCQCVFRILVELAFALYFALRAYILRFTHTNKHSHMRHIFFVLWYFLISHSSIWVELVSFYNKDCEFVFTPFSFIKYRFSLWFLVKLDILRNMTLNQTIHMDMGCTHAKYIYPTHECVLDWCGGFQKRARIQRKKFNKHNSALNNKTKKKLQTNYITFRAHVFWYPSIYEKLWKHSKHFSS